MNLRFKPFVSVLAVSIAAVWVGISLALGLSGFVEAFSKLGSAISIVGLLFAIFHKWGWRYRLFQGWLVPHPDVSGSWTGTLTSSWKDEQDNRIAPINAMIVIDQSLTHLSCDLKTGESSSQSYGSAFIPDDGRSTTEIVFSYTNTPRMEVRDRSSVHNGTMKLRYRPSKGSLEGCYWTDRGTIGDVIFHREKPLV